MIYPIQRQNLTEYKNIKFSGANLSLYDKGCCVVALTNLCNFFGKKIDPIKLSELLEFTNEGNVIWNSLTKIYPTIKFVWRYDWSNTDARLDIINDLLKQRNPLIVSTMTGKNRRIEHFLNLWEEKNGDYVCSCPLKGGINFKEVYGDPTRWIYKVILYEYEEKDLLDRIKVSLEQALNFWENLGISLKDIDSKVGALT